MHALKCLPALLALSLAGNPTAAEAAPRLAVVRALAAGAPEVAAPNLKGDAGLVTVTVAGAIEIVE